MYGWIAECLPKEISERILNQRDSLQEIRIRAGQPVQIRTDSSDLFTGERISAEQLRKIALEMMDYSYYTREDELSQGYFTMKGGCRVGVCGSYAVSDGRVTALKSIGSLCIRIAREIPGCASGIVDAILSGTFPESALIAAAPGLGKTTLLRDAARQLSEKGFCVSVADERHEIAACRNGIPTLDVGCRTDVADGCPKESAMEQLLRTMAPQVIVADEIGNAADAEAVLHAAHRGVSVICSAHAESLDLLENGPLSVLFRNRVFGLAFLLSGEPGRICETRRYSR